MTQRAAESVRTMNPMWLADRLLPFFWAPDDGEGAQYRYRRLPRWLRSLLLCRVTGQHCRHLGLPGWSSYNCCLCGKRVPAEE